MSFASRVLPSSASAPLKSPRSRNAVALETTVATSESPHARTLDINRTAINNARNFIGKQRNEVWRYFEIIIEFSPDGTFFHISTAKQQARTSQHVVAKDVIPYRAEFVLYSITLA